MDIIKTNQNQLVVEEKNWGLAIFLAIYAIVMVGIVAFIITIVEMESIWLKILISLVPAIFAVLMLYIFLSISVVLRCSLDRRQNLITIYQKSLLGQKQVERSIDQLERVEFVTSRSKKSTSYAVRLIFKGGEKVFLNVVNSFHKKRKQAAAKAIANFLGLAVTNYDLQRFSIKSPASDQETTGS
ncbi:hypothetical protein Pse7367_2774 [Thalassoporum mexicanum PCC 7367]|uniref:hypothetical protein n=1 Tax=Thalassoporum mexicanum TaxID=3457544 RepID=UPI00029FB876|nr:hypothetical protein [Pseudanabaena sp. PCC 7367]AFY71028.1 hypothetical protein Pse7367_2774 [Pseudanabaena sp. PCC 7367]